MFEMVKFVSSSLFINGFLFYGLGCCQCCSGKCAWNWRCFACKSSGLAPFVYRPSFSYAMLLMVCYSCSCLFFLSGKEDHLHRLNCSWKKINGRCCWDCKKGKANDVQWLKIGKKWRFRYDQVVDLALLAKWLIPLGARLTFLALKRRPHMCFSFCSISCRSKVEDVTYWWNRFQIVFLQRRFSVCIEKPNSYDFSIRATIVWMCASFTLSSCYLIGVKQLFFLKIPYSPFK